MVASASRTPLMQAKINMHDRIGFCLFTQELSTSKHGRSASILHVTHHHRLVGTALATVENHQGSSTKLLQISAGRCVTLVNIATSCQIWHLLRRGTRKLSPKSQRCPSTRRESVRQGDDEHPSPKVRHYPAAKSSRSNHYFDDIMPTDRVPNYIANPFSLRQRQDQEVTENIPAQVDSSPPENHAPASLASGKIVPLVPAPA